MVNNSNLVSGGGGLGNSLTLADDEIEHGMLQIMVIEVIKYFKHHQIFLKR
jgi:hypothetical protein